MRAAFTLVIVFAAMVSVSHLAGRPVAGAEVIFAGLQQQEIQTKRITGRENPELIPEDVAWLTFFSHMKNIAFDPTTARIRPERVRSLARYSLRIPEADVEIVVKAAVECLEARESILQPLDEEHRTGIRAPLTVDERKALQQRGVGLVLRTRSEFEAKLSAVASAAVRKYVHEVVVPTIIIEVPK